ncbi:hypothetical protein PV325_008143 [Microctonus aethiopoides]|uniref:Uncharacterized protein n=1 Tax=Microctonus aethiopoides TaxID=144406 RepID=A0AA39F6Z3_9HYME|nr:hypothetical protein PV325_008143 [Microctonus aethiopoides]KAK0096702.1 hypothetical protein PV326_004712 [Microctonus aethiopoides]KAK0164038.1 hypothetical protein PV328_002708 [Microctonus aethiopoides]
MRLVAFIIIFLLCTLSIAALTSDIIRSNKRVPRFISFDHKGGQIDVDLDLSIPFISIPLNNDENQPGDNPKSLVNINLKSLSFAALFATITAFIVPLFLKTPHDYHNYRLDDGFGFQDIGRSINELILGNNHITPCVQRAVCSAVMKTRENEVPTSAEKIIDGIANLSWFKIATNGTPIEEAINVARQPNTHCNHIYNGCGLSADIFQAIMNQLGIQ